MTTDSPAAWLRAGFLAGLVAGTLRALFWVKADGYLAAGLDELAASTFLFDLATLGLGGALILAGVAWLVGRIRPLRPLVGLVLAAGIFLLATGHGVAPSRATPLLESRAGVLANVGTAAVALLFAGLVALAQHAARQQRRTLITALLSGPMALVGLLVLATSLLASRSLVAARHSEKTSVVLISLDTLRADRLGCYGNPREITPNLDAFAAQALRFERAVSPYPWTLVSHATMLTGVYPSVHGAEKYHAIHPNLATITERFREAGYVTAAFVDGCLWLDERYGYAKGFQVYRRIWGSIEDKNAAIQEFLDELGEQPLFLFLHYFDIHSDRDMPYEAPPPFAGRFSSWFEGDLEAPGPAGEPSLHRRWQADQPPEAPSETEIRYLLDLYDEGVLYTDHHFGRLLAVLDEHGLDERGAILVTADHGEEFYEHGKPRHLQMYEPTLHVPLLLRLPQGELAGRLVSTPVSLVDIAPTLAELAGLEFTGPSQGRSLLTAVGEGEGVAARPLLLDGGGDKPLSLTHWPYKLLHDGDRTLLFDLHLDPSEQHDLAAAQPEKVTELEAILQRFREEGEALRLELGKDEAGEVSLTESEQRLLNAIGYLESTQE